MPSVLVTRPADEAALWVADLQARGLAAEAFPLIEIAPVPDAAAVQACWASISSYAALMFVSGNAVTHFFAARPSLPCLLPPALRFWAPGPGTARRLVAAGVPAAQIDTPPREAAQFDSEALWDVIGDRPWDGRKVLIVRGQTVGLGAQGSVQSSVQSSVQRSFQTAGAAQAIQARGTPIASAAVELPSGAGRDWLAQRLTQAGAAVQFVTVYERRPPQLDAAAQARIARSQQDGSIWLFSSSEALAHLLSHRSHGWAAARALATHPRIAELARQAGWGVVIESRPTLTDIAASIESRLS